MKLELFQKGGGAFITRKKISKPTAATGKWREKFGSFMSFALKKSKSITIRHFRLDLPFLSDALDIRLWQKLLMNNFDTNYVISIRKWTWMTSPITTFFPSKFSALRNVSIKRKTSSSSIERGYRGVARIAVRPEEFAYGVQGVRFYLKK